MARDEIDLKIIDKNLEEIKNPNDVNIISTYRVPSNRVFSTSGLGYALGAVKNGGGFVQLTEERSPLTYPNEPLYWFGHEVGRFYMENFAATGVLGGTLINKNNFSEFVISNDEDNKHVNVHVTFNDGKSYHLETSKKTFFNEEKYTKLGEEIKAYQEEFKINQESEDEDTNSPYVSSVSEDTFNNLEDLGFEDELETF